jgi:hypothetical protein
MDRYYNWNTCLHFVKQCASQLRESHFLKSEKCYWRLISGIEIDQQRNTAVITQQPRHTQATSQTLKLQPYKFRTNNGFVTFASKASTYRQLLKISEEQRLRLVTTLRAEQPRNPNPIRDKTRASKPAITNAKAHIQLGRKGVVLPRGKVAGLWRRPFTLAWCPGREWVALYLHSPHVFI